MSTSIELHLETQGPSGWVHAEEIPHVAAGYSTYAVLGWERLGHEATPIAPGRDLPADVSAPVKEAHDIALDHQAGLGASWFTLAELLPHRDRLGPLFAPVLDRMATLGAPNDVRMVFWFWS